MTALVLSGGGARGAYEAGVVAYVREVLARDLGRQLRIDLLCGTSIGALNACLLAATADRPEAQAAVAIDAWRSLRLEEILRFRGRDLVCLARGLFGRHARRPGASLVGLSGLAAPFRARISWRAIGANIAAAHLGALTVTATHVGSGRPTVFVEAAPGIRLGGSSRHWQAIEARIRPRHALASAAIPALFPPIAIDGRLFVDGGLRMNVPLSPAVRLGADRMVVVSTRSPLPGRAERTEEDYGTFSFLAGKAIDALLLEPFERDLERLRDWNGLLDAGERAFGPEFSRRLGAALDPPRPPRRIESLVVAPSQAIGALAAEYVRSPEYWRMGQGRGRRWLRRFIEEGPAGSGELASYLLFDGPFAERLIELGQADAAARRQDWLRLLRPSEPEEAFG